MALCGRIYMAKSKGPTGSGRILCCGEALIDMFPAGVPDGSQTFVAKPGGAVFNTAIALGRLGARPSFLTGLSTDGFGAILAADLDASDVDTSLCIRSNLPTMLAILSLKGGQASYTFYDQRAAGTMLNAMDAPEVPSATSVLFFGGISLCTDPCAGFYEAVLERRPDTALVMMDPNIRVGLIKNEKVYRARLARMIGQSDIIKVSDEDLDWLIPGPLPEGEKLAQLLHSGPSLVFLTRGTRGAIAQSANGAHAEVPARSVTVVDTVGAGDTFNAGVLAHLSTSDLLSKPELATITQKVLEATLCFATCASAITVSRQGANSPMLADVQAFKTSGC